MSPRRPIDTLGDDQGADAKAQEAAAKSEHVVPEEEEGDQGVVEGAPALETPEHPNLPPFQSDHGEPRGALNAHAPVRHATDANPAAPGYNDDGSPNH